jgi:hypothetical protein
MPIIVQMAISKLKPITKLTILKCSIHASTSAVFKKYKNSTKRLKL